MEQTPIHDQHNPDLLRHIPVGATKLIEIGCSSGALAREYKKISPDCHYIGVEISDEYASFASRYCDQTLTLDIEAAEASFWTKMEDRDCWIFGDTLEHLRDPWAILRKIRAHIPKNGTVIACIPNAQHWSLQARLCIGDFRYENAGLLDQTHLRWFTRQTIIEMFNGEGFVIEAGFPRVFNEPAREPFLAAIEVMAKAAGADVQLALADALPLQYVVRALAK